MKVIMLPTMLFLLIGIFFFGMILIKLSKNNPKHAMILILVPVVCIVFFLSMFFRFFQVRNTITQTAHKEIHSIATAEPYSNSFSPIWSEGIENEFDTDVYPSKKAAIDSIGRRIVKHFPDIIKEYGYQPEEITVFPNSQDMQLVEELRDVIAKLYPDIKCRIGLNGMFSFQDVTNKIGIFFYINSKMIGEQNSISENITAGTIQANILAYLKEPIVIEADFNTKPWIENFSSFINSRPNKNYLVAKSNETCLTPEEADRQAMNQAVEQIGPRLLSYLNPNKLEYKDILESGIVADKFVQSFDGSAGKIWREAILLDVSPAKLTHLANMISNAGRESSMSWARTILSIVGLFVLIIIVYAFLNAATRGYYTWSLRIVLIILGTIFLFIILTIS